jgi:hypothetical protein
VLKKFSQDMRHLITLFFTFFAYVHIASALNIERSNAIMQKTFEIITLEEEFTLSEKETETLKQFLASIPAGNRIIVTAEIKPGIHNSSTRYINAYNIASKVIQDYQIESAHILITLHKEGVNARNQLIIEVLEKCSAPLFQPAK